MAVLLDEIDGDAGVDGGEEAGLLFENAGVDEPHVRPHHPQVGIDHERGGQRHHAGERPIQLGRGHHDRIVHAELLREVLDDLHRPFVFRDPDDLKVVGIAFLQPDQIGNLGPARPAPCRPEVDESDLSPEVFAGDGPPVEGLHGQVGQHRGIGHKLNRVGPRVGGIHGSGARARPARLAGAPAAGHHPDDRHRNDAEKPAARAHSCSPRPAAGIYRPLLRSRPAPRAPAARLLWNILVAGACGPGSRARFVVRGGRAPAAMTVLGRSLPLRNCNGIGRPDERLHLGPLTPRASTSAGTKRHRPCSDPRAPARQLHVEAARGAGRPGRTPRAPARQLPG